MKILNTLKNNRQNLINNLIENIESLEKIAYEQQAEIERLQEENKNHKSVIEAIEDTINPLPFETDFDKAIKTAKSEAIKEFAGKHREMIMAFRDDDDQISLKVCEYDANTDNLLKEMVGDDNA